MKVLIENFPMSLLDFFKGKKYDNMLDFILDVLYACGCDVEGEINKMICKIFNVDNVNLNDVYTSLANNEKLDIESDFLNKLEDAVKVTISESILAILSCSLIPEIKNKYMDSIRYISDTKENVYKRTSKGIEKTNDTITYNKENSPSVGYISIPITVLDLSGKFNISPLSTTGMCIYDYGSYRPTFTATRMYSYYEGNDTIANKIYYSFSKEVIVQKIEKSISEYKGIDKNSFLTGLTITEHLSGDSSEEFYSYDAALRYAGFLDKDSIPELYEEAKKTRKSYTKRNTFRNFVKTKAPLSANELYKSEDLDTFIWYCLNIGSTSEMNKMIWDNRRTVGSRTDEEWEYWLASKSDNHGYVYDEIDSGNVINNETSEISVPWHKYNFQGHFPIMQLSRDTFAASEDRLAVAISAERYYRGAADETESVSTTLRLNHTMYKFNIDYLKSIKIFSTKNILAGFLNEVLNGSLLYGMEVNYGFNVTTLEQQLSTVIKKALQTDDLSVSDCFFSFSNDDYNSMLYDTELRKFGAKNINNSIVKATSVDVDEVIGSIIEADSAPTLHESKTTITRTINEVTATPVGIVEQNADLFLTLSGWQQIVYNIIYALIKPILMSLFAPKVILLFMINFYVAGFVNFKNPKSSDDILDLISRKMFAILKSVIMLIKDKIIEMLLDLFYEYITPIITSFIAVMLMEYVEKWIKLLDEVMECLPMFDFSRWNYNSQIDYVNYADIAENVQDIPENTNKC